MEQAAQPQSAAQEAGDLFMASAGAGPLLERDYWGVIRQCHARPTEVMAFVRRYFECFPPTSVVVFEREHRRLGEPLELGDRLRVHIKGAGHFGVRVIHLDPQSITLGTLRGHPEAGRITFGAYRNRAGDVIFHIRSRARASSRLRYFGFVGAGEALQTRCWADFVNRVAEYFGDGVIGWINAETRVTQDEPAHEATTSPTYLARGDA